MKKKSILYLTSIFPAVALSLILSGGLGFAADDGPLFQRNISGTPELHSEHAALDIMPLYVPAQNTAGGLVEIEYPVGDCTSQDTSGCIIKYTRLEAKPLVATYLDGAVDFIEGLNFSGHGRRDAYAAYSFDDGATWKSADISRTGDLSSFTLADGTPYPGDVFGISSAVVGSRVIVAWMSRYCAGGNPLYAWEDDNKDDLLVSYPELNSMVDVIGESEAYQLYTDDLFGVSGVQRSSDFGDEGYPEVGEVPYACLWTARGTLEQDSETGLYDITWRAAERVTSGVRDVNLVQVDGTSGGGFVVVWQEDPEGLRPGKAECVDGGFNGAIAHHSTDIWYTYIAWDHFDDVCLDDNTDGYCIPGELADFTLETKPRVAVPMAMPVRLSDNELCKADVLPDDPGYRPYCYTDFDDNGTADACATSVEWTNPGGTTLNVCKAEDGRVLTGRTFATRPVLALKPYTNQDGETSAWVVVIHERSKAMGADPEEPELDPIDIGKDIWYRTFDMFNPEVVDQGMMLNGPAVDPVTGGPFEVVVDEWGNEYLETEISRHANLAVQGTGATQASESKTSAILLYKQGILNQGGPADVFMHQVVLPGLFDPAVDNPFAYENVQCVAFSDEGSPTPVVRDYADGSNPNYVRGLCPEQGMNVSGTTIVSCDEYDSGDECAAAFPWDHEAEVDGYAKVIEWEQTEANYNDPSWANPYDVSGDHQGFIDGDFVMLLYTTAPNWKASTIGRDAYNLYARRSFDGGRTWTTLPASYDHIDGQTYSGGGTTSCEWYGFGNKEEYEVCTTYSSGEFEQARNLSQLTGSKVTVLDPRLSPTGGRLKHDFSSLLCDDDADGDWVNCGYTDAPYPEDDDIRDPSAFFVSYQTGNNRVVSEDTGPEPMDIYYSKAFSFGDDYDLIDVCSDEYPGSVFGNPCGDGEIRERFDWLAMGKLIVPENASLVGNPSGERLYAVWNQLDYDKKGNLTGDDAWWRRIFYDLTPETF